MDNNQTVSLLLYGCQLTRELESSLPNLGNRPDLVADSCERIVRVFTAVQEQMTVNASHHQRERQMNVANFVRPTMMLHHHHQQQLPPQDYSPAPHADTGRPQAQAPPETSRPGSGTAEPGASAIRVEQLPALEVSDPGGRASPSSFPAAQRSRRRKDDQGRRTVNVEAHLYGNPEIPPEDGFTWKKYGQKEILGSQCPRSYYRCTHQKLYHCPAKKQVQRLDSNPNIFQVTYRGEHTCHMSSTAPSIAPPPPSTIGMVIVSGEMTDHPKQPPLPQASTSQLPAGVAPWMSMDFTPGTAGPSAAPRDDTFPLVADMADAMFNSGSSSSTNSMDVIFSSMDHRDDQHRPSWDAGDKRD